jgi:hypothetical protein
MISDSKHLKIGVSKRTIKNLSALVEILLFILLSSTDLTDTKLTYYFHWHQNKLHILRNFA